MRPCSSLIAAITAKVVTFNFESSTRILSLLCAHPFALKVLKVNTVSSRYHHLSVRFTHLIHEWVHAMEERAIMRLGEVYFSLASLDVFKPDFVLQVNATDGWWRYLLLTKSSMEHLHSLASDRWADSCNVDGETKYPMCCYVNLDQFGGPISKE